MMPGRPIQWSSGHFPTLTEAWRGMAIMKNFKRTTVTAALPYANGGVHIGHLAGVYVPADIYVRYLRLKKQPVIFIGGSDEHGVPITIRAKKRAARLRIYATDTIR